MKGFIRGGFLSGVQQGFRTNIYKSLREYKTIITYNQETDMNGVRVVPFWKAFAQQT